MDKAAVAGGTRELVFSQRPAACLPVGFIVVDVESTIGATIDCVQRTVLFGSLKAAKPAYC